MRIPIALSLLLLGACSFVGVCEAGQCYGSEPVAYKAGDVVTIPGPGYIHDGPFLVRVVSPSEAQDICRVSARTITALSCMYWREPERHGEVQQSTWDDQIVMPYGYSCVVIAPPVGFLLAHELRHCREGAFHE